jgi:PTS system mannitol-specific IIC component
MATTTPTTSDRPGVRVHVQRFGTFLSNMIMPNIPALIGWGLFTALFIDVGWLPNADLATFVGPAIHYLLPILIAATGGRMVYGDRGAVVGGFATMGVIAGSDFLIAEFNATLPAGEDPRGQVHMFIGAMIMGPLAAYVMKRLDALWEGKIKAGFEMLVNMFSAGITAFLAALFGFFVLARIVNAVMDAAGDAVEWLVDNNLLPATSIIIEPAKVLFLNNAINHGVLTPLGLQEAADQGKSVLFLLEANPGPGLGLLLAFTLFGRGLAKASAPGAAVIQFLGGIHEIYFPYVLMKPKLIVAMIAGGMSGVAINVALDVGLVAPAAPGSIFAVYAQTARGDYFGVTLGVFGAAAVSFTVASFMLRLEKGDDDGDLVGATAAMEANKGRKSSVAQALTGGNAPSEIRSIVFACDAGMGSSAMGASVLRKKIHGVGHTEVTVVNKAIANLGDDYDLVVTHQDLTDRARQRTGSAIHVSVENFMQSPVYDEIVDLVRERNAGETTTAAPTDADADEARPATPVLAPDSIVLDAAAESRDEAIARAGALLVEAGAVEQAYVDAMHEREKSVSTYMGNLLALPHGTNEAKGSVRRTALSFVRYPDGIDWGGKQVRFVVGVAAIGDDHMKLLRRIAGVFVDQDQIARLEAATSTSEVLEILGEVQPV